MRKKEIKVEWCENWIKAKFSKLAAVGATGIYTGLFWKEAELAGLYTVGTYNSPMTKALMNLCYVADVLDDKGRPQYSVFKLLTTRPNENEMPLA